MDILIPIGRVAGGLSLAMAALIFTPRQDVTAASPLATSA